MANPRKPQKSPWRALRYLLRPSALSIVGLVGGGVVFVPSLYSDAVGRYAVSRQAMFGDIVVEREDAFDAARFEAVKAGLRADVGGGALDFLQGRSLMEGELCARAFGVLAQNPWVRKPDYVCKKFPDSLRIGLRLWRPAMYLATADGLRLVGSEPFALDGLSESMKIELAYLPPVTSKKDRTLEDLPTVVCDNPIRSGVGAPFFDVALQTAAVFSEWLFVSGRSARIMRIDVSDLKHVKLETSCGVVFDWGASPFVFEMEPRVPFAERQEKFVHLLKHLEKLDRSRAIPLYLHGLPYSHVRGLLDGGGAAR